MKVRILSGKHGRNNVFWRFLPIGVLTARFIRQAFDWVLSLGARATEARRRRSPVTVVRTTGR